MQAFLVVPASHSAVASLTSSMHRQGLPRLINSDLEAVDREGVVITVATRPDRRGDPELSQSVGIGQR